jgi:NADH:ubiquinone oxidoreductase subunit E
MHPLEGLPYMTLTNSKDQNIEFSLNPAAKKKVKAILDKVDNDSTKLIQILQAIQEAFNYLPEPVLTYVSELLEISEHKVYGVATFYSQFKFHKPGEHIIRVCLGTACHVKGAPSILNKLSRELGIGAGETSEDGLFSLETVYCLGCCALAPVMVIDEDVYGNMSAARVLRVLKKYKSKKKNKQKNRSAPKRDGKKSD